MDVQLINNDNLKINGDLKVYNVDKNDLSCNGTATPNSASFTLDLPPWSIDWLLLICKFTNITSSIESLKLRYMCI